MSKLQPNNFFIGMKKLGYTKKQAKEFRYCGADTNDTTRNYWNLTSKNKQLPAKKYKCICGKNITNNYYITNDKDVLIICSNCNKNNIKHNKKSCEKCGENHRNIKDNFCNACRKDRIEYFDQCDLCKNYESFAIYNSIICDNCINETKLKANKCSNCNKLRKLNKQNRCLLECDKICIICNNNSHTNNLCETHYTESITKNCALCKCTYLDNNEIYCKNCYTEMHCINCKKLLPHNGYNKCYSCYFSGECTICKLQCHPQNKRCYTCNNDNVCNICKFKCHPKHKICITCIKFNENKNNT